MWFCVPLYITQPYWRGTTLNMMTVLWYSLSPHPQPCHRSNWVLCDDTASSPSLMPLTSGAAVAPSTFPSSAAGLTLGMTAADNNDDQRLEAHHHGGGEGMGLPHEQVGLYVRSQCLPFIEAGCSSWGETSMFL